MGLERSRRRRGRHGRFRSTTPASRWAIWYWPPNNLLGQGKVFVLADTTPLHNEAIANSYPFVGRLLAYLAHRPSSPQTPWRQLLAIAALAGMLALLAGRPAGWQLMLTPAVMAVSLACCTSAGYWSGRVLPDGRAAGGPNRVAYIDASHLEAYSSDPSANHGMAGLMRALMRHGYLPLMAPDLTPERLERSGTADFDRACQSRFRPPSETP